MMQCYPDEFFDVLVVEGIEHHLPLFSLLDETEYLEQPHLVRHCRLCDAKDRRNVEDAQLLFAQGENDFQSRLVAEDLECFSQADNSFLIRHSFSGSTYGLSMIMVGHVVPLND